MSGSYVDCAALPKEWDDVETIRERLRAGNTLVSTAGGPSVKITRCVANSDVLIPVLAQIGAGARLAEVDGLREAVAATYQSNSRDVQDSVVDDDAWAIREMVAFIKRKAHRQEPSLANWISIDVRFYFYFLCFNVST